MPYDTLLVERDKSILTVTLNRPPMNAISRRMEAELRQVLTDEGTDDAIRVLILRGAGERAFSVGADIAEFAQIAAEGRRADVVREAQAFMTRVQAHPKPIIAAVQGYALGGGCELAMACHLRVVDERAQIGLPEIRLGLVPAYGGTQLLPRLVGKSRAIELMLLGRRISGEEAFRYNWANRVAPAGTVYETAREWASTLAAQAPLAMTGILTAVNQGMELTFQDGLRLEGEMAAIAQQSEDAMEGAAAFFEKREPRFTGQ